MSGATRGAQSSWSVLGTWTFLIWATTTAANATNRTKLNVTIGVTLPWHGWPVGDLIAPGLLLAMGKIENDAALLPDHNVEWVWADDGCDVSKTYRAEA